MPLSRTLSHRPRLLMDLAERGVAGVELLGRYNYTSARPALREHVHPGAMEVCFLVKGCQTYSVGDRSYRLTGGDVFIAFPNERHSTGGLPEEKGVLYWLVLDVGRDCESFLGYADPQAHAFRTALLGLKSRHFRGSWKMKEYLDGITALFHGHPSPLTAVAMTNQTGAFLLEMIACARSRSRRSPGRALAPVLEHIKTHLDEPLPVERLAQVGGLSVSRFKSRFKQEIGVPPAEYVMRERINRAESLLQGGGFSVTRVALDLGFSSSQYFATVFKRFTGRRPSASSKRPLKQSSSERVFSERSC